MKKNVFSRTLAVLASTVVLGAASMMSASAAGESLTITSAEGAPGDTVTLNVVVAANNAAETLDSSIVFDEALTMVDAKGANADFMIQSEAQGNRLTMAGFTMLEEGIPDGAIAAIQFTIPEDAEIGAVYNVEWDEIVDLDAGGVSVVADLAANNGTITVVAPETDPTDAPTEATEAPTTTTAKAPTTGAPKTGTAGVAVAVAGLVTAGATAVVLKKRH